MAVLRSGRSSGPQIRIQPIRSRKIIVKTEVKYENDEKTGKRTKRIRASSPGLGREDPMGRKIQAEILKLEKGRESVETNIKVKKEEKIEVPAVKIEVETNTEHLSVHSNDLKAQEEPLRPATADQPTWEPANWRELYAQVKHMREQLVTPVDVMGCHMIPERILGASGKQEMPRIYRFQLLVTLMLSAQTKDEVNFQAMKKLDEFLRQEKKFPNGVCLESILEVSEKELDAQIYSVGFHSKKAKYIKQTAEIIRDKHNGDIPKNIDEITAFPGVGPKMGYLLLQKAWNISDGIGVDTHIHRLAGMWRWIDPVTRRKKQTPETTRESLERWLPRSLWAEINPVLVGFGQTVCPPRAPRCDVCTLAESGLCAAMDKRVFGRRKLEASGDFASELSTVISGKKSRTFSKADLEF